MITWNANGRPHHLDLPGGTALLWMIRETIGLTGTKFGCGVAPCGAGTVHLGGQATRSWPAPISWLAGKSISTIEGLSSPMLKRGEIPEVEVYIEPGAEDPSAGGEPDTPPIAAAVANTIFAAAGIPARCAPILPEALRIA